MSSLVLENGAAARLLRERLRLPIGDMAERTELTIEDLKYAESMHDLDWKKSCTYAPKITEVLAAEQEKQLLEGSAIPEGVVVSHKDGNTFVKVRKELSHSRGSMLVAVIRESGLVSPIVDITSDLERVALRYALDLSEIIYRKRDRDQEELQKAEAALAEACAAFDLAKEAYEEAKKKAGVSD